MERLTEICWKNLGPWECCGQDHFCHCGYHDLGGCTGGCIVPKLYARLAAYEDTGLEPEKIMGLCSMHERAKMAQMLREEENRPLTLEELREMDGVPCYIVSGQFKDWRIPDRIDEGTYKGFIHFTDRSAEPIDDYGKTWLAYRGKLEEGTHYGA